MSVLDLIKRPSSSQTFNATTRAFLEDHMQYLRNLPSTTPIFIDSAQYTSYKADLYGLLSAMQIPMEMHWVIMRVSGLTDPALFDETVTLLNPDARVVNQLLSAQKTQSMSS